MKKAKIAVPAEDAKMLTLKVTDLDDNARMIMQAVCCNMLQRQKDELERTEHAEKEAVAAYTTVTAD